MLIHIYPYLYYFFLPSDHYRYGHVAFVSLSCSQIECNCQKKPLITNNGETEGYTQNYGQCSRCSHGSNDTSKKNSKPTSDAVFSIHVVDIPHECVLYDSSALADNVNSSGLSDYDNNDAHDDDDDANIYNSNKMYSVNSYPLRSTIETA